jgi:hypothetical protein
MILSNRTGRYRSANEPTNYNCDDCNKPIWTRIGVFTQYHGQCYYNNDCSKTEPESVLVWDDKLWQDTPRQKIVCYECSNKYLESRKGTEL